MNSYDKGWGDGCATGTAVTLLLCALTVGLLMAFMDLSFTVDTDQCHITYNVERYAAETKAVTTTKYCKE